MSSWKVDEIDKIVLTAKFIKIFISTETTKIDWKQEDKIDLFALKEALRTVFRDKLTANLITETELKTVLYISLCRVN